MSPTRRPARPARLAVVLLAGASAACSGAGDPAASPGVSTATDAGARTIADAGARDGRATTGTADGGAAPDSGAGFTCPAGPFPSPLAGAAAPAAIDGVPPADGFVSGEAVLEGPVWIDGALYMSQFANTSVPVSRILRWTPGGGVSVFLEDSGTNGLAVDTSGALLGAVHKDGSIRAFAGAASSRVLAAGYGGARFDSPNDLAVAADGALYFSDPTWQSPSPAPQTKTRVYRLAAGAAADAATVVDDTLRQPNGVTLAPDGARLYVSSVDGVFAYDVAADGTATNRRSFASGLGGVDGMGIDCAGNLYASSGAGIVVLAPSGAELGRIAIDGAEATTNVAFGGADHKTLFVTHRGTTQGLHSVALQVPGLPY